MRNDMAKVIVERPRWGSKQGSAKTKLRVRPHDDFEEKDFGPSRYSASAIRQYGQHAKAQSDRLGPLRRFLHHRVGLFWDDVYREIRANLDTRTVLGRHLLSHLCEKHGRGLVDTEIYQNGPELCTFVSWYRTGTEVRGFYVDPATGVLRYAPRKNFSRELFQLQLDEEEIDWIPMSAKLEYWKLNGFWFALHYEIVQSPIKVPQVVPATQASPTVRSSAHAERLLVRKQQCARRTVRWLEAGLLTQGSNRKYYERTERMSGQAVTTRGLRTAIGSER